jgi:hypothetical protein
LSTTKKPASSRALAAVLFPDPDIPEMIIKCKADEFISRHLPPIPGTYKPDAVRRRILSGAITCRTHNSPYLGNTKISHQKAEYRRKGPHIEAGLLGEGKSAKLLTPGIRNQFCTRKKITTARLNSSTGSGKTPFEGGLHWESSTYQINRRSQGEDFMGEMAGRVYPGRKFRIGPSVPVR